MLTFWPKQPHGRRDRSIWESTSCSSVIATCVQCHKMLFCLMILLEQRFKKWANFAFYFISFSIIQYNNVQYVQCWKTYTSVNQVKNHSTVTWISHLTQGYESGGKLCLSCDCVRFTLSMMFGWLYFSEKLKSQNLKENFSTYLNPYLKPLCLGKINVGSIEEWSRRVATRSKTKAGKRGFELFHELRVSSLIKMAILSFLSQELHHLSNLLHFSGCPGKY